MSLVRSGLGWLLAKVSALGISFLATMYFTRALADPTEVLGLFKVFETAVSFATLLVSAGLGAALTKRISEDRSAAGGYFGAVTAIIGVLLIGVAGATFVFRGYISEYFSLSSIVVLALPLLVGAVAVRNTGEAVLRGYARVGRSGATSMLDTLSRSLLQIGLVSVGFGLMGLVGGATAGALFAAAIAIVSLPVRPRRPERHHLDRIVSFAKFSLLRGFSSKFYDNIDIIVIAALIGESAVSVYSVPFQLSLGLMVVSGAVGTTALPEISRHAAADNFERVREVLTDGVVFSTILAIPATVGAALLARPIIVTLFTPAFAAGAQVAVIAIAIQIPDGVRAVLTNAADGVDRPDLSLRGDFILIGTNVVLDILLVPLVGIEGAAVASFLGITFATVYTWWALIRELEMPWWTFPARPLAAETGAALVMGAVVFVARETLHFRPIPELLVLVPLGVVVYGVVVLAVSAGVRNRVYGAASDALPFQ